MKAGVAKWQTHGIQNPAVAIPCWFKSDLPAPSYAYPRLPAWQATDGTAIFLTDKLVENCLFL